MQKISWLYPSFLRKIDHYLKINYPHIWRTRVHDFGWFSLVLGNAMLVVLGMLIVGRYNFLEVESIKPICLALLAIFVFVGLFWAMHLMRFQTKFSDFKTMLITWIIYILCIVSLGGNVAVFVSSVAYRTAYMYSDEMTEADFGYIQNNLNISTKEYNSYEEDYPYERGFLRDKFRTEYFLSIMHRHGYRYSTNDKISRYDIEAVRSRFYIIKEAKFFAKQPIFSKYYDNDMRTSYHDILRINWLFIGLILSCLPMLLFLASAFGARHVLISIFCTALIVGLISVFVIMRFSSEALMYVFTIFILGIILLKERLKYWNYIVSVFMMVLGAIFFRCFAAVVEHSRRFQYDDFTQSAVVLLIFSSVVLLTVAWKINQHNNQPVLR